MNSSVALIAEYANEGRTWEEIADSLNELGVLTATGKTWTAKNASLVASMNGLRRKVLAGKARKPATKSAPPAPAAKETHRPLIVLPAGEVAALFGVATADLDHWVRIGRGPTRRSDGTYVRAEVHMWADTHGKSLLAQQTEDTADDALVVAA